MIYREGMAFLSVFERHSFVEDGGETRTIKFCLNDTIDSGDDYVVGDLNDLQANSLDPLQNYWILDYLSRAKIHKAELMLNMSIQQIAQVAMSSNPCIAIPYEKFE